MSHELKENEVAQRVSNLWTIYAERGGVPLEELKILEEAHDEIKELHTCFESNWRASMRAIQMWQEKTGKTDTWPDHAYLCVFLMEEVEKLQANLTNKKPQSCNLDKLSNVDVSEALAALGRMQDFGKSALHATPRPNREAFNSDIETIRQVLNQFVEPNNMVKKGSK